MLTYLIVKVEYILEFYYKTVIFLCIRCYNTQDAFCVVCVCLVVNIQKYHNHCISKYIYLNFFNCSQQYSPSCFPFADDGWRQAEVAAN